MRCRSCPGLSSRTPQPRTHSTRASWCTSLPPSPGSGGLTTVAERPCEWRALARWPEAQRAWNSGARCGLMLPASKTGTLSAAAVARRVVVRPEAVGHAGPRCSLEWPGDTATIRWCREAACPEGDAVCGCESLISKWLCERFRFRTVLKSGSGLSVAALWACARQRSARIVPLAEGVQ